MTGPPVAATPSANLPPTGAGFSSPISRLVRNSSWNLFGQAVPMLTALVTIPLLIRTIGSGRFGFLSIGWVLIGYFSLFDLGIGRALTHGVATRLAHDASGEIGDLVWTGLAVLGAVGLAVGGTLGVLSGWVVHRFMTIQPDLQAEAVGGIVVVATAVPFVVMSAGLRGILEAKQEFRAINLIVTPLGVLLFLGPLVTTRFSVGLPYLMLSLLFVRVTTSAFLFALCVRRVRGFLVPRLSAAALRELLSFGGWMTVSNIVSPIMVNMDRLFVSSMLSVAAVTYYATPFEVISKVAVLPGSIASVCFPEFARLWRAGNVGEIRPYFLKTMRIVVLVLVPPAILGALLASVVLRLWISPDMASRSAGIMRVLAVGVVLNGLAYIPFAFVQGIGRSDVTAKFHLLELALYLPTVYLMIGRFGLMGAAMSWVFRVLLDACLLFGYTARRLPGPRR